MGGRKKVVVVGGSGYLGQHLLELLSVERSDGNGVSFDLAFTHHRPIPPPQLLEAIEPISPFQVDLKGGGEGFEAITHAFGQPDVVVNCAALSVPRACESDPESAMAINVPTSLVNWLSSFQKDCPLLIHLSTDQVYEGTKSFYKEDDDAVPVNTYGKSKLAAEQFISANYPNFVILRSSIIYGPQTVSPVERSLFLQWIDSVLSRNQQADFFVDEFRCPIFVKDLVNIISLLMKKYISDGKQMQLLLNAGGPDRVSRVQMAEHVAAARGYQTILINAVSSSSVDRGVVSPADISMDTSKLIETLDFSPVSFRDGIGLTLGIN